MGKQMSLRDLVEEMVLLGRPLALAALAARRDPKVRPKLNELRKRYAATIRAVGEEIEFGTELKRNPALAKEFQDRFSQMRGRIAIFQAKFPASIMDGNPAFNDAAAELRKSNADFIAWAREALR
jgi:hypothetical protein